MFILLSAAISYVARIGRDLRDARRVRFKFVIVAPMRRMTSTELYLRLLRHVSPYRHVFGIALLGMVVVALTEVALPALLKPLLDGTFVHKDPTLMRWMPLVVLGLTAVRGCAEYAASYCVNWVGNKLVTDVDVRPNVPPARTGGQPYE